MARTNPAWAIVVAVRATARMRWVVSFILEVGDVGAGIGGAGVLN